MNKHYYSDPTGGSARWHSYGEPADIVVAQATKLAMDIGEPVPVSYEDITTGGQVRGTGDYAICHPSGKVHYTGRGE